MERILVVEDEPTNRTILVTCLQQAGYTVDEAEDGVGAWELLKGNSAYAIIVTDRRMPNMDGLELALRIKGDPLLRYVPVLMQTASDKPEEVVEGITAGVYYYLVKPYKEETLLALVQAGIRERRQHELFEQRVQRHKEGLNTLMEGQFHIHTPEDAQSTAYLLGNLFPRAAMAVSGLYELMLNAIEHGNLAIGFEEKTRLLNASSWEAEIARRIKLPQYADKKVVVEFKHSTPRLEVVITDEGNGFDWRPFLEIEPGRATQSNGRGIAKANLLSFQELTYLGKGNQVKVAANAANP